MHNATYPVWMAVPCKPEPPAAGLSVELTSSMAMGNSAQAVSLGSALITAVIAAVVGGLGWICAYFLTGWRDDRTKRLQLEIEHTSSQIKEFYAPLVALTDQLNTTVNVLEAVRKGKNGEDYHRLTGLIYNRFFLPIHEEINVILKTKVHLLEGVNTPKSFVEYFQHYATEKAYWNLTATGEDVSKMRVPEYPSDFYHDIRSGYALVIGRYEQVLKELRERRWLFNLAYRSWPRRFRPQRAARHPKRGPTN